MLIHCIFAAMKLAMRLLFVFYALLLVWVSVNPSMGLSKITINETTFRVDYPLHAIAFILFPIIGYFANGQNGSHRLWWAFNSVSLSLAIGTEYLQLLISQRTFNPYDILSNVLGLTIGIVLVKLYRWVYQRQKQKSR